MDEEFERVQHLYKRVFSTPEGLLVLTDIINDMKGLSKELEGEKDLVLQNQARHILSKCGAWQEDRIYELVAGLMHIDWKNVEGV